MTGMMSIMKPNKNSDRFKVHDYTNLGQRIVVKEKEKNTQDALAKVIITMANVFFILALFCLFYFGCV